MAMALLLARAVTEATLAVVAVLVVASAVGGLSSPAALAVLLLLGRDQAVMGDRPISRRLATAGSLAIGLVVALGIAAAVRA